MSSSSPISSILACLKTFSHPARPELGDIVSCELVAGVAAKESTVTVSLHATYEEAQAWESWRQQMRQALEALPGVERALVVFTEQKTHSQADAKHQAISRGQWALRQFKHIIAVASGKGGVGKSTVCLNLAASLSQLGLRVGILDADIYGPSLPKMLGLHTKAAIEENKKLQILEAHGLYAASIGFLIDEEQPVIWRGPMVQSAVRQLLQDVNWPSLDVLLIDLPPGTGDIHLTLVQKVKLDGAVIVSTPQDLALLDAKKALFMFQKLHIPILGLIENMSVFTCPNCGHDSAIFTHGGAEREAKRLKIPFLGAVPLEMELRESADKGKPYVQACRGATAFKIFEQAAQSLVARLDIKQAA